MNELEKLLYESIIITKIQWLDTPVFYSIEHKGTLAKRINEYLGFLPSNVWDGGTEGIIYEILDNFPSKNGDKDEDVPILTRLILEQTGGRRE